MATSISGIGNLQKDGPPDNVFASPQSKSPVGSVGSQRSGTFSTSPRRGEYPDVFVITRPLANKATLQAQTIHSIHA